MTILYKLWRMGEEEQLYRIEGIKLYRTSQQVNAEWWKEYKKDPTSFKKHMARLGIEIEGTEDAELDFRDWVEGWEWEEEF